MSRKVTFSNIQARNLAKVDGRSDSDPYVKFLVRGETVAETDFLRNPPRDICTWEGSVEATVRAGNSLVVAVEVWDKDRGADDIMGRGTFTIVPGGQPDIYVPMEAVLTVGPERGTTWKSVLTLSVELDPPMETPPPPPTVVPPTVAPEPAAPATPAAPAAPAIVVGGGITYAQGGRLVGYSESPEWDEMVSQMPAWCSTDLPKPGEPGFKPVVRKELRKMTPAEQSRYAAAVLKMRENGAGPGTSPYFRLAAIHGGFPPYSRTEYPSYCSHGRENFPQWHRPYLVEFERMMRRADLALGNDGDIGLPYWGWEELEVDGQVVPRIVREQLLVEFDDDFFPPRYKGYVDSLDRRRRSRAEIVLRTTASDARLKSRMRARSGGPNETTAGQIAYASLYSDDHKEHACKTYASGNRKPSIETPHDSVHGAIGGVMASFRSSFSPIFWLHHNNVERFYESYLQYEPDSASQFRRHQRSLTRQGKTRGTPGFPDGPWGEYYPFVHPTTGQRFHVREGFDAAALGFAFDDLPRKQSLPMREPPYYAVFENINVLRMEEPRVVYVYVSDPASPPALGGATSDTVTTLPGYAGSGSIFFFALEQGACENCFVREAFDLYVDVTAALRAANLNPKTAVLHCLVENDDGEVVPLAQTPVPPPHLRGPQYKSLASDAAADPDDTAAVQAQLVRFGLKKTGVVDGKMGPVTAEAIKAFQKAAGLVEDGVAGPETKLKLAQTGMLTDAETGAMGLDLDAEVVKWWLDTDTLPAGLSEHGTVHELSMAFGAWSEPAGVKFVHCADEAQAAVKVSWADNSKRSLDTFDGPGGKLAIANAKGIVFDSAERWELQGVKHKQREWISWENEYFQLLPVALHEVGHVIGLGHSDDPSAVMSPYYFADRISLTDKDKEMARALKASKPKPKPKHPTQAEANKYVQQHGLEAVLGDMVNALLPTGTTRPLTAMSAYLADRAAERGE